MGANNEQSYPWSTLITYEAKAEKKNLWKKSEWKKERELNFAGWI